jgi:hypothetical protein
MAKRCVGRRVFVVAGLLLGGLGGPAVAQELTEQGRQQISAILAEKAARTPAQRKLATSLLYASRESVGQAMVQGLQPLRRTADRARVDSARMVVVDIRAEVTDRLLQTIADLGGAVLSSQPAFGAVRARVPIRRVEALAALPEVRFIGPQQGFLVNTGSQTSQGDIAHAAASARSTYSINGTGVKVGVLSDGVASLAARQATGDLPATCAPTPGPGACVTVVPGQAGDPVGDEGTALMEIVHDLAPGAQLYFAGTDPELTLDTQFAANILTLRSFYGCDIIVDDITYFNEGAFQDGVIAQAVNTVKAAGALFFSSAGNSGRLNAGTSGTWEGDFVNSLTTIQFPPELQAWQGLPIHSFNGLTGEGAAKSNQLTATAPYNITLKWSDPLGGAVTDYDLFLMDSSLTTVWDGSADDQATTHEPFEIMGYGLTGETVVIVRWSGPAKALRLDTHWGRLALATRGAVFGHNGGESTITVAAANVSTAGGGAFTGGATNPIETYSADGPRRIFYNPDGSAITPGNFLFGTAGGRDIRKPDITAADCVTTTTPGFTSLCGTSAAAPHAAAIAALLKSAPDNPSGGQALAAMFATALDVNPAGRDRDAGVGIVMANLAADALTTIPPADFYTVSPCRVLDTRLAGPQTTGSPLACGGDYDFTMVGGTCGVPSGAKAVSLNVTVTAPSAQGNLKLFASGAPPPLASTQNYAAGQTRANNAVAPLSSAGKIAVRCSPSGTAHVIVDVNGYFQ